MRGIIERYWPIYEPEFRQEFKATDDLEVVTLEEGSTPLIPAPKIAQQTKIEGLRVYLKYEGLNPTGSFKDRGMTMAMTHAKASGAQIVICASTGNTSASAAAYAARAGLKCIILLPQGKVALGKLSQAILYGAEIVQIDGNFDQALDLVRIIGKAPGVAIVNSINPWRILGQQSGAFEVCDQLARDAHIKLKVAPDYHFIPVGNAGNITAYWAGYKKYQELGKSNKLPKMMGYEAEGSAAIVFNKIIEHPETLATAIRIGNPASWHGATTARDESGGFIEAVTDDEIIIAYQQLASLEGVFCEPASAASVAGLFKACAQNQVVPNSTIVCTLTGNGLKDPDNAIQYGQATQSYLPPDAEAIMNYLKL